MTGQLGPRAQRWAGRRETRLAGRNPWAVAVCTLRWSAEDRLSGLAAEMAFFSLLSVVPLVVALGASLGWLERVVGSDAVATSRGTVLAAISTVFSQATAQDVMRPLVRGLLEEQRGGVALSGVVLALWLASRVFTATIRALDLAYNIEERRGPLVQRLLALLLAVVAVIVASLILVLSVLGPLLGTAGDIARRLGLGGAFTFAWQAARWPLLALVAVGFFATVYRLAPNIRTTWRQALPGAFLGVGLWLSASALLRVYLAAFGSPVVRFAAGTEAAALLAVVGAVVAAVIWTYVSGLALLVGGELNAVLLSAEAATPDAERARPAPSAELDASGGL